MSRLQSLGLTAEVHDAYQAFEVSTSEETDADVWLGRVARVDRGEVAVLTETGELRALSDSQRAQGVVAPATGDWVAVQDDEEGPFVARIFDRRTAMVRRDPAEQTSDQVLVANIDKVAVVQSLDQPANDARIERFLVLAIDSGADPVIVLTKSDLEGADRSEYAWLDTVAPIVVTSAMDHNGIDELTELVLPGETLVFIGPSGVGKSTLVNAMVGEEVAETAEVREKDRRGRHTTTVRELIELPTGGVVIDTPGIRAIGLWAADIALDEVFADIAETAEQCRFRDCTHRQEPGCAVVAGVETGTIDAFRLARYQLLWQELAEQAIDIERQRRTATFRRHRRRR